MDATVQKVPWPWYVRLVVGRNPMITLIRALVWAGLIVFLAKYVFIGVRVRGQSMEPTFYNGQVKFVYGFAYVGRATPQRGDIVAIRAPELGAVILKRVIALPGERLTIRDGRDIFINGEKLHEPYKKGLTPYKADLVLEPNQYWLIGDNRDISDQYLKYDYNILGKVIF